MSLDQKVLHAYVAMQNLAYGRPLNEIAEEIGRSRFATARMVKRARDMGLVEVRAMLTDTVDIDLSTRLISAYGLRAALVVSPMAGHSTEAREAVAAIAAKFIVDNVEEDDVLGFTPGRTLVAASRLVTEIAHSDVVQLTGVGAPKLEDGIEAILNVGRMAQGGTYPLYAPLFIQDAEARTILQHPAIKRTLQKFNSVTKAFLTVGGWPDASLLALQLAELGEMERFEKAGVVAEIGTMLLDEDGRSIGGYQDYLVGISEDQLRKVPTRVAVGGGPGKEQAVIAVLRSGIADVVITDALSARAALEAINSH